MLKSESLYLYVMSSLFSSVRIMWYHMILINLSAVLKWVGESISLNSYIGNVSLQLWSNNIVFWLLSLKIAIFY